MSQLEATRLTQLTALPNPDYQLRGPIPVRVNWSTVMGCYLAVDEVFGLHGQGADVQAALQDLAFAIIDDYNDLTHWSSNLSKPLSERYRNLQRYIVHAGQSA